MSTKVAPGTLIATPNATDVAREACARMSRVIRETIASHGVASIALSGGNTPRAAYALLAKEGIDWTKVEVFWVDERAVAPTDDRSNYHHAKESLLDPAGVHADRIHRMEAERADLDAAARAYEALLSTHVRAGTGGVPAFDLMVLGVGDDGHTASLFPGETTVDIRDRYVVAVAAKPSAKREARMTLTAPVIQHARNVFILAVGKVKHEPLDRVWNVSGDIHETPARIIRDCQGAIAWIIDRPAGGLE